MAFVRIWNSDLVVMLRRLAIVYLMLVLCRVVFYLYNSEMIGSVGTDEIWSLTRGALLFDSISVVYAYGVFVLLSLLPFRFRASKIYASILFWYFIIVGAVVAAINLGDAIYFHYTQTRFTAADVMFADNDNTLQLIGHFMLENWYLVLVWAAIVVMMTWLYRYTGKPRTEIRNNLLYYSLNTIILAAVALGCVAVVRGGGLSRMIRPVTLNNAMAYTFSPTKAKMILSNPFCIIRTLSTANESYKRYFTNKELSKVYTPYHYPSATADSTHVLGKRNIVIFVLESFSAEHSAYLMPDLYPNGGGYTPFLDSLMRDGYTLRRAYACGYKSIDALPSILYSIPSFRKPFVLLPKSIGKGRQLPKILKDHGYETMFFCGSKHGSMGFDAAARLAGVREIFDMGTYDVARPGNKDYDGTWGVWDEPFLNYMGEVISEHTQPFFATVFTLSSHHPFRVPKEYEDILPKGITKNHQPVAYTDMAVRKFFESNKDKEWMRNTIFVFVADHVSSERFAPETETSAGRQHIITFFYTPDGSLRGDDSHVFQQTDIMPTLLGLTGIREPYFSFGRDIFNEPERVPRAVSYPSDFQIITDSLTMMFDETKITSAYAATDKLQEHNRADPDDPAQQEVMRLLEGIIQQYYTHLQKSSFVVK
jgi:phosphoglycerol transferase MdoB-like AlkP superfamily enzyme